MPVRLDGKKRSLADAQLIGCCWRKPCIWILIVGTDRMSIPLLVASCLQQVGPAARWLCRQRACTYLVESQLWRSRWRTYSIRAETFRTDTDVESRLARSYLD